MDQLPATGFLRLPQIIGQRAVTEEEADRNRREAEEAKRLGRKIRTKPKRARPAIPPLVPVGKSSWWEGVANGMYPRPTKALGRRVTAWRVEDIRNLIASA